MVHQMYALLNGFCILMLTWTAIRTVTNKGFGKKEKWFAMMLVFSILFIFTDAIGVLVDGKKAGKYFALNYAAVTNFFILGCLIGFCWFFFSLAVVEKEGKNKKLLRVVMFLPTVFEIGIVYTSRWTKLIFYIDEHGIYYRGNGFLLGLLGPIFYLITTALVVGSTCVRDWKEDSEKQKVFLTSLTFSVIPLIGMSLQAIKAGYPFTTIGLTMGLLYVFMHNQERMIIESNQKLFEQEKKVNLALQEAVDMANKANQAKTEFLSHMSHDIRTPMNGIMGMADIAETYAEDPERVKECMGKIKIASGHLLALLNDVLDMSKLESGKIELLHEPFELLNLLEGCISMVRNLIPEQNITFESDLSKITHTNLIGSAVHIRQILMNVLTNSVKYNRNDGKITLSVEEISYDSEKMNATYRIVITDTGIGMSQEFQKHMFEPFTQEHSDSRTHYKGTGLGMAIVKELLEEMGGKISVQSQMNKGTVVEMELSFPIEAQKEKLKISEQEDEKADVTGMKILLVEDNEINMEIAVHMLKAEGTDVVTAKNGLEAVELVKSSPEGYFDLIFMDIMMPIMDGLEATRQIRKLEREDVKYLPILAMTANAYAEDVKKEKEAGMDDHVSKPIRRDLIQRLLQYYRLEKKKAG